MNQISTLKSIIREAIQEMELDEMARIAELYTLTDNYMEALAMADRQIRNSIKTDRVVDALAGSGGQPLSVRQITDMGWSKSTDTASVSPTIRALLAAGVIQSAGLERPKAEKPVSSGIKGRPAKFDRDILDQGKEVLRKYAQGDTNYTEEEIAFIKALYSSFQ